MSRINVLLFLITLSVAYGAEPAGGQDAQQPPERDYSRNIELRCDFSSCRGVFSKTKKGHVAFMGGSITEMDGYRPIVCNILEKRFPETEFTFLNAGISSTGSTTGAFRLSEDVFSKGKVDLFFVEFAVNDDQDGMHADRECVRGMEGVIRQIREHNPQCDIVLTYFCNQGMVSKRQRGEMPTSMAAHEKVAKYYQVSTVHLATEVAQQITDKVLTWQMYGGTHPNTYGNTICAHMIRQMLFDAWKQDAERPGSHALPEKPLDSNSYVRGRLVEPSQAETDDNWKIATPDWKSLKGSCRKRFSQIQLLFATEPDSKLTLKFHGTGIGAFVLAGPDAGQVAVTIDGKKHQTVDLYHRYSGGLHYPRTVMFAADLENSQHVLELRIASGKHEKSIGHCVRIIKFAAN